MVCRRLGDRTFGRQIVWENDVLATGVGRTFGQHGMDSWATKLLTDGKLC